MTSCHREADLLEVIADRGAAWRNAANPDLMMHVGSCALCRDLADVAGALHEDQVRLIQGASVPSAGLVWWRANIRVRLDAARTVERPLTLAPGAAAAVVAGVGAAIADGVWHLMPAWPGLTLVLCAAGVVVVSPLLLVIALARD
jgi:hypothetical protein